MRRLSPIAAGLAIASLGIAGCGESGPRAEATGSTEAASEPPTPPASLTDAGDAAAAEAAAAPADNGADPAFTETYPGARVEQATRGEAGGADGGLVVFTTDAPAEDVIAFYRDRAETAGLAPTMAMTQGDTHAYGAAHPQTGTTLSVVASPDGERTSVQLSWTGATTP